MSESNAGAGYQNNVKMWTILGIVGIICGIFSGLFGIGGGTIIVPALVALGFSQRHAVATSLAAIVPTSIGGVASYAAGGDVDWIAAALLASSMIIGSQLGSWLLSKLSELFLRWMYAAFLVFVVITQIIFTPSRDQSIHLSALSVVGILALGIVIGMLSGLLGIGGGAIAVPSLSLFFGASDLIARGTSLLAMFPSAIAGTIANWKRSLVHLAQALTIGIVAAVCTPLGNMLANAVSPRMGANLFALYFAVLLIRCVYTALQITPCAKQFIRKKSIKAHDK